MLKRTWKRLEPSLDYLDVAAAAILGFVFTILGLVGVVNGDTLSEAALALLAVLAFSLLQERRGREHGERLLNQAVAEMRRTVRETQSDYPYLARTLELRYDLVAADGTLAHATKTREIRFTRNNVLSVSDRFSGEGEAESHDIMGGPKDGNKIVLPRVRQLRDEQGRPIDLISLERPRKLGEVMEIVTRRTLRGAFTEPREYISIDVEIATDEVAFHVTWPAESPPHGLELNRTGRVEGGAIPLDRLQLRDGRQVLVTTISDPQEGESITLFWDWAPTGAG